MKITVEIPDDVAERMLSGAEEPAVALLELALYTAVRTGRISDRNASALLGSEDRFYIHSVNKKNQREIERIDREYLEQEFAPFAPAKAPSVRSAA